MTQPHEKTVRWPLLRALIAFLLVAGFLVFSLFRAEAARTEGAEVILETRPIDPRDLFFGHFATLGYNVESAPLKPLASAETLAALAPEEGDYSRTSDAYVALAPKRRFHEVILLTVDLADAAASGVPLKVKVTVRRGTRCKEESEIDGVCPVTVSAKFDLPARYYAEKETALALQQKSRAAGERRRAAQNYQRCLERRARAQANPDAPPSPACEAPPADDGADLRFGVILSVSDQGEAVIKGLEFDNQRVIDTLGGPRLTLVREKPPSTE